MTRNVSEIQQRLMDLGFLPAISDAGQSNADGTFGIATLAALNHYLASKGRPPINGRPSLISINAIVFPEEQPAPPPKRTSIFDQIGTILSLINLLKGKAMTKDQIGGIVRAILSAVFGYITGKGWLDADTAVAISGALATIAVAAWSVFSNRPAKIG